MAIFIQKYILIIVRRRVLLYSYFVDIIVDIIVS